MTPLNKSNMADGGHIEFRNTLKYP